VQFPEARCQGDQIGWLWAQWVIVCFGQWFENYVQKKRTFLGYFFSAVLGVDVMITIFWDFCQFSAKKLAFFCKIAFYLREKRRFISPNFSTEIILKIVTPVPVMYQF
jgi:hypothetical protein